MVNLTTHTSPANDTQEGITVASAGNGGLITMQRAAAPGFMARTMRPWANLSEAKRGQAIMKKKMCAAIGWLRAPNKLTALYIPRSVVGDDETNPMFLGTISNKASTVRPKTIPRRILRNVLVAVNQSSVPSDIIVGPEIDKTNALIKKFFYDDKDTLFGDEQKVLA